MKVMELKKEDLKELKEDGYNIFLIDNQKNIIEISKNLNDIKTKKYDDMIIF